MPEEDVLATIEAAHVAIAKADIKQALVFRGILARVTLEHPTYEEAYKKIYDRISVLQRNPHLMKKERDG